MVGDVVGGSLSDIILKKTGNAKVARRVVAAPGFLLAGAAVIPAALTTDTTTSILCLAASFFFSRMGDWPGVAVPWMWADSSAGR